MDIVLSAILILALLPLLALLAILVRVDSRGPSLFRQSRVGHNGRDFELLKFRTMTERSADKLGRFDAGDVSRVTRVGRILRTTKLDELPQLWNVLKGDMSIVGPRPEVREWVNAYPERWQRIHRVRPGITDPASIAYRNEEELLARSDDPRHCYQHDVLPKKLVLYEKYVENHNAWQDIVIMLKTVVAVVRRR